ncbi:MAG: hypothetical protein ACHQF2_00640 [Flavobacteriales bacterium]
MTTIIYGFSIDVNPARLALPGASNSDSLDIVRIERYLLTTYNAKHVDKNRDRNSRANDLYESGPYKVESKEIVLSVDPKYRIYTVCSATHGIPAPSFRMTVVIGPDTTIQTLKYNDCSMLNSILKKERAKTDLKTMAVAVMKILTCQSCINEAFSPDEMKTSKTKRLYTYTVSKGEGYGDKTRPAYEWKVQFDKNYTCVLASFNADLPPVP